MTGPVRALAALAIATALVTPPASVAAEDDAVLGGQLPPGYRDWTLISVAHEEGKLNDLRAILGNEVAVKAYRSGARPFPDGAIIARLAWDYAPLAESAKAFGQHQSYVAGPPKNGVQFMVKDARRYAATGGWGYAQFDDGKATEIKVQACFACHQTVEARDFVFNRYAP